jgi:toxin ParE1/3/4
MQDILDTALWYEDQREGLGKRFRASLDRVLRQIEVMPELHRVFYHRVRRALTPGFPFGVYYRVEGDEVIVLAVAYSSRDPDRWKERL